MPKGDDQDTRTRILEAARKVLIERGFEATSMRAIAAEAGVAVGLANYHFDSRRALLAEVVETSREHFLGVIEARLPEGDGPEAMRQVHEIAAGLLDLMPDWYRLCAELDAQGLHDEEIAKAAAANKREGQRDMHQYLGLVCQRFAVEPPPDFDGIAAIALAALDGIAIRALLDPEFDLVGAHRALERMIIAAIEPGAEPLEREWNRDPYAELKPQGERLRGTRRKR